MIKGMHHVAIVSHDMERLIEFYGRVMGFELVHRSGWPGSEVIDRIIDLKGSAAKVAMMRAGNLYLELFQFEPSDGADPRPVRRADDRGFTHFCLAISDIEAEYERMSAAGMHFHCEPQLLGGGALKITYGRDPDGNLIELMEACSDAAPYPYTALAV